MKATREQVVMEWTKNFEEVFKYVIKLSQQKAIVGDNELRIKQYAVKLANDVVDVIERAVRANKGRGI